jgi:hypothetical protein
MFGELHGYSGKLRGAKVEAEGAPMFLSMVACFQWWTVARSGGDPTTIKEGKEASDVRHNLGQLFEEEGSKGLTSGGRF